MLTGSEGKQTLGWALSTLSPREVNAVCSYLLAFCQVSFLMYVCISNFLCEHFYFTTLFWDDDNKRIYIINSMFSYIINALYLHHMFILMLRYIYFFFLLFFQVNASSVFTLIQSDIKNALKSAFGILDGPLSATDWCKGRSQSGDVGTTGDGFSAEHGVNEGRDSSSTVTIGEPISPSQSSAGGSSCIKGIILLLFSQ